MVRNKEGALCWSPSDDPIYYTLKEVQDARSSLSLALEEQLSLLSDAIQSSDLQFRLVLISTPFSEPTAKCAIAMAFSHAVMDGLSRITFMNELLSFASQASSATFSPAQLASLPVLPSLIEMMGPSVYEKFELPKPALPPFNIAFDHAEKLCVLIPRLNDAAGTHCQTVTQPTRTKFVSASCSTPYLLTRSIV